MEKETIICRIVNAETNEKHEIVIKDIEYIIIGNYGDKTTNSAGIKSSFHDDRFELCIDPDQYKCIVEDFGTGKINYKKRRIFKDSWMEHSRDFNIYFDADEINFLCKSDKFYVDGKEILY
ncbi:hypothetical protein [Anaerostipes butyraticus]|nr:hypothetical protein [Anaerostipes butyraticus]